MCGYLPLWILIYKLILRVLEFCVIFDASFLLHNGIYKIFLWLFLLQFWIISRHWILFYHSCYVFFFSFSRGDKSTYLEGIFKLDIYFHLNIFNLSVSFVLTIISLSIYSCIKSFESNVTMCIFMIEYYLLTYFMFTYNFEFITTMLFSSLFVMLIFLLFPFYLLQSHFFFPRGLS